MAFIDLEKAFDQVPRKVIWWVLRKLGVEEWIVRLVQGMYANARSRVHVGEGYSEEFEVKVGVHQGSVLSPLLLIIVRVRVTDRHCHHLRRKIKFGTKNHKLAKTSGEKKYRLNYPLLSHIIVARVYRTFLDCIICQLTTQLSIRKW